MMIQKLRTRNEEGFTLIELMVVVAIIGILAAIGMLGYQYYLNRARYSMVVSDIKNASNAAQLFFVSNEPSAELDITVPPDNDNILNYRTSEDVTVTIVGNLETLFIRAEHPLCDKICEYDSAGMRCYPKIL